jgi:uncharacterized protein (TIGR00661 family)
MCLVKILYGVQATGHGHLVRSTPVIRALRARGHEVQVLLSGPRPDPLWLERIGEPLHTRPGLTFSVVAGEIRYLRTVLQAKPLRFVRDVLGLRREPWDLVVTDYEPVTAWHARLTGQRSVGIGHLYAFMYDVPMARGNLANRTVLRQFAPVHTAVGSHYAHFGAPVLPPFVAPEVRALRRDRVEGDLVLAYLPWEDRAGLVRKLRRFPNFRFRVYDRVAHREHHGNVEVRPLSRHEFADDIARCRGIIANAGFTLSSEALHLGISLLVKPIHGQVEQESNAVALQQLGLGAVSSRLSTRDIADWLMRPAPAPQCYPDVTAALVDWLDAGASEPLDRLSGRLWGGSLTPANG